MFSVQDLLARPQPRQGEIVRLVPSHHTLPEPPELPEPSPLYAPDGLVEFIRRTSSPATWEDPMSLESRNGVLLVRNHPAVFSDIEKVIERLRREAHWTVTTQLDVVEMPDALLESLRADRDGLFVLSPSQRRVLDAAISGGTAHRSERITLPSRDGVPNSISSGKHVSYLQDYATEVAEGSAITNPVIQSFFSGLSLTVTAGRTSGDGAVALDVRATRSEQNTPMRRLATPRGHLELPRLEIFRVRTGLLVPLGASVLLAAQGEGPMRRVMLLTPTLQRR